MVVTMLATSVIDRAASAAAAFCNQIEPLLPADATLVHWSLYAWLLCLLCLSPALLRIALRRSYNLDPIWAIIALLALNRLSFLLHISVEVSHATGLALALAMTVTTTWYQRWDRAASR